VNSCAMFSVCMLKECDDHNFVNGWLKHGCGNEAITYGCSVLMLVKCLQCLLWLKF